MYYLSLLVADCHVPSGAAEGEAASFLLAEHHHISLSLTLQGDLGVRPHGDLHLVSSWNMGAKICLVGNRISILFYR